MDYFKQKFRVFQVTFLFILLPNFINAQTPFQQGEELFKQEKFSQAKPFFESYLKQNSKHKKTLEYLGDIGIQTQHWDDALMYYETLIKAEESNAQYHYKYGGALGMKAMSVNKLRASTYLGDIRRSEERRVGKECR